MSTSQQVLLGYGSGSGFVIPRSLRFRASASANLSRTFGTPTNADLWTFSAWIKRGQLGIYGTIIGRSGSTYPIYQFVTQDSFGVYDSGSGVTTAVYRDPSAWYHLVIQRTSSTSVNVYFNNSAAVTFAGQTNAFNISGNTYTIGKSNAGEYFDGYMAEVNFIDGQALTPTSFGTTSTTTGVWSPVKYTGTYGNNGFHLDFNSYATTAALGTDTSGNSNTFTVNNCSVTAGVTYDSMIDVPTVTATGSNYAVINPLNGFSSTIVNANLTQNGNGAAWACSMSSMAFASTDHKYCEVTIVSGSGGAQGMQLGIIGIPAVLPSNNSFGTLASGYAWQSYGGTKQNNGSSVSYNGGATYATNDIIGIDYNNGTLTFYKNNTSQGSAYTGLTGTFCFASSVYGTDVQAWNFGQRPFTYTPPSGYSALNTYNLAAPSILKGNLYMDATTYTGTGASQSITSLAMQPDFTWLKARSSAENHRLFDSVRGVGNSLISNATNAEASGTDGVSAFNSNGFTLGTNSGNTNAVTYVSWNWKGGGAAVSNTSGSITSSVSANTTSGCSIVTYTGTGANATVGHGLGVAPSMVITKGRDAVPNNWGTWHTSLGALGYLYLNNTTAAGSLSTFWNSAVPTSSVFSLGSETTVNTNTKTYVAYCFAQIAGYSAFGSYTGNNLADGPFAYLGFRARWIMLKQSSAGVTSWWILDTATGTYNVMSLGLAANDSSAESSGNAWMDITANGFKIRQSGGGANASGQTYIYAAFAENPFNNSLAR